MLKGFLLFMYASLKKNVKDIYFLSSMNRCNEELYSSFFLFTYLPLINNQQTTSTRVVCWLIQVGQVKSNQFKSILFTTKSQCTSCIDRIPDRNTTTVSNWNNCYKVGLFCPGHLLSARVTGTPQNESF